MSFQYRQDKNVSRETFFYFEETLIKFLYQKLSNSFLSISFFKLMKFHVKHWLLLHFMQNPY